jgi:hypothetical protein
MRGMMYYNLFRESESPGAVILAYFLVSLVVFLFTTRRLWLELIRLVLSSLRERISEARFNRSIKSLEDSQIRLKDSISKIEQLKNNGVASEKRKATLSKISSKLAIVDADLDSRLSNMRDMKRIFNQ